MISAILSGYAAGVATSLTPCVYPLLPISVGYIGARAKEHKKIAVVLFVLGQSLVFMTMGLFAVKLGEVFGAFSESVTVQRSVGTFLIAAGILSLMNLIPSWQIQAGFQPKKASKIRLIEFLLAGAASALVASPCATPVLAGVLSLVANYSTGGTGPMIMFFYGLGMSTLFLIIGLGITKASDLPRSGLWMVWVHRLSALLLIGSGVFFLGKSFELWTL